MDDRPLLRKAFAVSQDAEPMLRELWSKLSVIRSQNVGELARKAKLLEGEASRWIATCEDSLLRSICRDALDLAGLLPFPAPLPIPEAAVRRFRSLSFAAKLLPWEDQL